MPLTAAQLTTLKVDIDANSGVGGDFENIAADPDGHRQISVLYNLVALPDNWVFKMAVDVDEMIGGIDFVEFIALPAGNISAFELLMPDGNQSFNPTPVNARDALVAIFPAATAPNTRGGLLDAAVRLATRGEKLFSVNGTGPGGGNGSAKVQSQTLVFEGAIAPQDVETARELP